MIYGILIEGLIYGIMALGIFVSFRVINFCDMTVDGAFPLGGCILAACLLRGVSPVFALSLAFFGGARKALHGRSAPFPHSPLKRVYFCL